MSFPVVGSSVPSSTASVETFKLHNETNGIIHSSFIEVKCISCLRTFLSRAAYENHFSQCQAAFPFIFTDQIISTVIDHELAHPSSSRGTPNARLRTPVKSNNSFANNFKSSEEPRSFKCGTCERVYISNSARRYHERKHHLNRRLEGALATSVGMEQEGNYPRQNGSRSFHAPSIAEVQRTTSDQALDLTSNTSAMLQFRRANKSSVYSTELLATSAVQTNSRGGESDEIEQTTSLASDTTMEPIVHGINDLHLI